MKQILLSILIIAASWQVSQAQAVTKSAFSENIALLDKYIGNGDMANANASFDEIKGQMRKVLHDNKINVANATTESAKNEYLNKIKTEGDLFNVIWKKRNDLPANRASLHEKLNEFALTLQ